MLLAEGTEREVDSTGVRPRPRGPPGHPAQAGEAPEAQSLVFGLKVQLASGPGFYTAPVCGRSFWWCTQKQLVWAL